MKIRRTVNWYLTVIYIITGIWLFLYSYTQVDLNLTLSRVSIWQTIQKSFQYIGYFQRPLSTLLYVGIILSMYLSYYWVVYLAFKKNITLGNVWSLIIFMTVIGLFAYPAFSYDFFNYMFTAKSVLVYHQNPYQVTPLSFTGVEPWLSFMRWTHLSSAYSPLWIGATIPFYMLGFGNFLSQMFAIKLLIIFFYLLACWSIYHVLVNENNQYALAGLAIFGLNPLVLIEGIFSPHNDMMMMGLAMYGIFWYVNNRKLLAFGLVSPSAAVKTMTIFLLPMFLVGYKKMLLLALMGLALLTGIIRKEPLPWYVLWVMPFISLIPENRFLMVISGGLSMAMLLRYAPYLYYGEYHAQMLSVRNLVTIIPLALTVLIVSVLKFAPGRHPRL